ncbi:MAG: 16S rRNA (guanine(527)-N(7))-methyltransferase RsmG [Clostridiales bacterium]|nr:16S rRNA (guanine(527)-N(7))-methyltransferase RsmG [Clostridiales bacterium]
MMNELFSQAGLSLNDEIKKKLSTYSQFLVEYNEKVNLTAITDSKDIIIKHFIDSILPLNLVEFPHGASLIDVGTGAGFPSLPMKIYRDDLKITMLDSLRKRLDFLEQLCIRTETGDVEFIHSRAEDGGKNDDLREKFDIATARAVANLRELSEYCLPYVKVGGMFVALKARDTEQEIAQAQNAISTLGGQVDDVIPYKLPTDEERTLVIIKKISQTPTRYPRNSARISKKPL